MLKWEYKFYGWISFTVNLLVWNQQTANTVLLNRLGLGKILQLQRPTYQDITPCRINNSWSEIAVSWMLCLLQLVNKCTYELSITWEWALTATELISEASESMLCGIKDVIECVCCLSIDLNVLQLLNCFFDVDNCMQWTRPGPIVPKILPNIPFRIF